MKNLTKNGRKLKHYFSKSLLKKSISDQEFDELGRLSVRNLFSTAHNKVGITQEDCIRGAEIIISPPNFSKLAGMEFLWKKGKDNYLRFMPVGITIYNFTEHSLFAYQCDFDPTTENALNESTSEYFYNDIVSFETLSESSSQMDYDWKDKIIKGVPILKSLVNTGKIIQSDLTQKFVLTTAGGSKVSVTLSDHHIKEASKGGEFFMQGAQRTINVVRRVIRDKKTYDLSKMTSR